MKLKGQLGRSFQNFLTLRGLAKMGDLEKISKADDGFQRPLDTEQTKKMIAFLKDGQYTFYPELILIATMYEQDDNLEDSDEEYNSFLTKNHSKRFTSFKLSGKKLNKFDIGTGNDFYGGILKIDGDSQKLIRIDGNHRLSVTQRAGKQNEIVPFCIIFTRSQEEFEKTSRILFTNINYKQLPLTPEENYRIIFGKQENGNHLYSDEELKNPIFFGNHFLQARKFLEKLSLNNLSIVKNILEKNGKSFYTRTAVVDFFEKFPKNKLDPKDAFFKIEEAYKKYPNKSIKSNYQLLVAHLYFFTESEGHLKSFSNWVLENRIYELDGIDIKGIVELYKKILESKERTVFLAIDSNKKAKANRDAIEDAIKGINKENQSNEKLELKLVCMNTYTTGNSFSISEEILKQIESSGYFIADLTLGNKNVYHEIGYRMGLKKKDFLLVHNDGVGTANFQKDTEFNISGIQIINAKDSNDLRKKVKKQLKKHYGIS